MTSFVVSDVTLSSLGVVAGDDVTVDGGYLYMDVSASLLRITVGPGTGGQGKLGIKKGITITFDDAPAAGIFIMDGSGASVPTQIGGGEPFGGSPFTIDTPDASNPSFFKSITSQFPSDRWIIDIGLNDVSFVRFGSPIIGEGFDYVQMFGSSPTIRSPTFGLIILPFPPTTMSRRQRPFLDSNPILGGSSSLKFKGRTHETITMNGEYIDRPDDDIPSYELGFETLLFAVLNKGDVISFATPLFVRNQAFLFDYTPAHAIKNIVSYTIIFVTERIT